MESRVKNRGKVRIVKHDGKPRKQGVTQHPKVTTENQTNKNKEQK